MASMITASKVGEIAALRLHISRIAAAARRCGVAGDRAADAARRRRSLTRRSKAANDAELLQKVA